MPNDDRTYRPTIRENALLAGGMRIAEVSNGRLIFEDRYQRRCHARGSDRVSISLYDFLDILIDHYSEPSTF